MKDAHQAPKKEDAILLELAKIIKYYASHINPLATPNYIPVLPEMLNKNVVDANRKEILKLTAGEFLKEVRTAPKPLQSEIFGEALNAVNFLETLGEHDEPYGVVLATALAIVASEAEHPQKSQLAGYLNLLDANLVLIATSEYEESTEDSFEFIESVLRDLMKILYNPLRWYSWNPPQNT